MRLQNGDVLFAWPLAQHVITAGWTYNGGQAHNAIDLRAALRTPVYAAEDGTVDQTQLWDGVTDTGNTAFQYCYGVAEYHLKPTTPPTLASTNAFNNIPSDCIIYVPKGCLEAYQNATNWATYADHMQEEPT